MFLFFTTSFKYYFFIIIFILSMSLSLLLCFSLFFESRSSNKITPLSSQPSKLTATTTTTTTTIAVHNPTSPTSDSFGEPATATNHCIIQKNPSNKYIPLAATTTTNRTYPPSTTIYQNPLAH